MQITSGSLEIIQSRRIKRELSYGWLFLDLLGTIENVDERCTSSLVVIVQSSEKSIKKSMNWSSGHRVTSKRSTDQQIRKKFITLINSHFHPCCDGTSTQQIDFVRRWQTTASLKQSTLPSLLLPLTVAFEYFRARHQARPHYAACSRSGFYYTSKRSTVLLTTWETHWTPHIFAAHKSAFR